MKHYRRYYRRGFDFDNFEITKREIIASISIFCFLMLIGFFISSKISERHMDNNEKYNKAVKIQSSDLFQYGIDTNIGNAFVYGKMVAVDTVTYPNISGQYMYVEKVKEVYTMHTRTVTSTVNGKTRTRVETYWTWDRVWSEDKKCKQISFCNIVFDSNKFSIPSADYIDTVSGWINVRYKYYGTPTEFTGTIFTELKDHTIKDNSPFYENKTIDETVDYLERGIGVIIFWIFWIILMVGCIFAFYYIKNDWLE